jgi:hypothetical protein
MWTLNRVGRPEIYYQIPNSNKYSQVSRWRSQEQEERVSTTTALCVAGEVVTHAFTSGARATAAAFSFRAVSVVALFSWLLHETCVCAPKWKCAQGVEPSRRGRSVAVISAGDAGMHAISSETKKIFPFWRAAQNYIYLPQSAKLNSENINCSSKQKFSTNALLLLPLGSCLSVDEGCNTSLAKHECF